MIRPALAIALSSLSLAGGASGPVVHVRAELRPSVGFPEPAGSPLSHGSFTATIAASGARWRFLWTILFFHLTGPASKADLHLGPSDGGTLFTLCRPCKAGQSGSTMLTPRGVRAITSGRTYVVVHTATNAGGEIRGRLVAVGSNS